RTGKRDGKRPPRPGGTGLQTGHPLRPGDGDRGPARQRNAAGKRQPGGSRKGDRSGLLSGGASPRRNIDVALPHQLCLAGTMVPTTSSDAELLEAAKRAFAAHGYAGATLERIAAEAGVNRVTLHRRGVSKDGLLAQLAARGTEVYQQQMWPALTGPGSGAE